jgi:SpoIID/LytB domain protein
MSMTVPCDPTGPRRRRGSVSNWLVVLLLLCASAERSSALQSAEASFPTELRVGFARPGGGYALETIPLEMYVARVLAGEAARESPAAALEALAVTIRTYALGNLGRHRADGFDLCDETHCQVVRTAVAATHDAAQATAGRVLMQDGRVATVFYSASCGGRTEIPSNVWPGADDPSYLPSTVDDACGGPEWEAVLTTADLLRAFQAAGFRGERLRDLRIVSRNSSDRVARLHVEGLTPSEVSGQQLRVIIGGTLGWQHIRSAAFELQREASGYRFTGQGSGHGVGLCVIGSTNLAAAGTTASEILEKYFPGTSIAPPLDRELPAPGAVLVSARAGDAGERAAVSRLTSEKLGSVADALGLAAPRGVALRIHPSVEAYRNATGQAWFTRGAWVDGVLHLPPLSVLRDRGGLDWTITYGLVHALADDPLLSRPAWVREGLAIHFSERLAADPGTPPRPDPHGPCPDDDELLRPVSPGAFANAAERARACVARQLEAGRDWREVR